jgi:NADH-quinone oxidoreductase subunit M
MGLLSSCLAIWMPIAFGILLLAFGRDDQARTSCAGPLIRRPGELPRHAAAVRRFDTALRRCSSSRSSAGSSASTSTTTSGWTASRFWFVLLTAFITVVVVISAWEVITERVNQYMGAFLILSGLMIGVFCALDGMLFYVFFEATLIPMYLIIGIWGGPNKIYAAFKFFLYTLLGSLLMLVALVYLYTKSGGSFDILTWHKLPLSGLSAQTCCSSPSSRPSR